MKVLFTFGGLPHYLNPILNRLNEVKNLEVVVAIPDKNAATIGDSVKMETSGIKFKVIYLEEKKAFYGNYYLANLIDVIKSENPEILVTIWPYVLNLVADFKLKRCLKKKGIKVIIKEIPFDIPSYNETFKYYKSFYARTLNEDMIENSKVNLLFYLKHLFLRAVRKYYYCNILDASVAYVDEAKEIASSYGLKKENVFISTNSPDTDEIFNAAQQIENEALILSDNQYRIVHVGRLVKWKRVDLLVEAVALLRKEIPEIELLVIGKGKEENNLKGHARELGVGGNVKFIGGVYENKELGRYLNTSSVYVLAGMGGLSINQAMAFGKPVICSIADGTEKRLVKEGFNGFYFENGNAKDLANKIKMLLLDVNKIKEFGQNSLSIIKKDVNVYTVLNGYLNAFNHVTNNKFSLKLEA
jgi:glycosyltransferase involved in cell wall biosynthesis